MMESATGGVANEQAASGRWTSGSVQRATWGPSAKREEQARKNDVAKANHRIVASRSAGRGEKARDLQRMHTWAAAWGGLEGSGRGRDGAREGSERGGGGATARRGYEKGSQEKPEARRVQKSITKSRGGGGEMQRKGPVVQASMTAQQDGGHTSDGQHGSTEALKNRRTIISIGILSPDVRMQTPETLEAEGCTQGTRKLRSKLGACIGIR